MYGFLVLLYRRRSVPVPVTGVHYNSLLWMCMLNTLTWSVGSISLTSAEMEKHILFLSLLFTDICLFHMVSVLAGFIVW